MAVNYKTLYSDRIEKPLTKEELELITLVELDIDKMINNSINIHEHYYDINKFKFNDVNILAERKNKMVEELINRYEKNNWKIIFEEYDRDDQFPNVIIKRGKIKSY